MSPRLLGKCSVRTLAGRLQLVRWRRPLSVELELSPWSTTRAELSLRPRRPPPFGQIGASSRATTAALDTRRADVLACAPAGEDVALRRAS